jgi:hypothetical protein
MSMYDPLSGRTIEMIEQDGLLIVKESIPKDTLHKMLDRNKAEYNAIPHKQYKSALREKTMWRAASIPNIIVEKWKKEEGLDIFNDNHWPKIREKLNSEEYKFLRTSPGKI